MPSVLAVREAMSKCTWLLLNLHLHGLPMQALRASVRPACLHYALCATAPVIQRTDIHACCTAGPSLSQLPLANKPGWLRQRAPQGERYDYLSSSLRSLKLNTVCEEAQCPNVGECWNTGSGTATIMLLGAALGHLQHPVET